MARTAAGLPPGTRLTDHISLGVLTATFPIETVREVLTRTGRASQRERALPAHVMVYYAIALALYADVATREILRCLLEGVRWLGDPATGVEPAGKWGISQARTRLGAAPLEVLYRRVVEPVAAEGTPGAWYRGWRVMSLDGTTLDVGAHGRRPGRHRHRASRRGCRGASRRPRAQDSHHGARPRRAARRPQAEVQGTVVEVGARPGERVEAGALLVRFDPRPFDLAVRADEAAVADTRVRLGALLLGDDPRDTSGQAVERRRRARLRVGLDAAETRLERGQLDRERAMIRAPFAGTVDAIEVVVGQRVSPADVVARLVDTTSRGGRVLARVRGHDAVLRPGMYADVELEATRLPVRVIVPAAAVIERDGRPLVFRYRAGRAEWLYVAPGRSNGRETEVCPDSLTGRTAVTPGDTVLVEAHLTLTHDAPVRLLPREGRRGGGR